MGRSHLKKKKVKFINSELRKMQCLTVQRPSNHSATSLLLGLVSRSHFSPSIDTLIIVMLTQCDNVTPT